MDACELNMSERPLEDSYKMIADSHMSFWMCMAAVTNNLKCPVKDGQTSLYCPVKLLHSMLAID